MPEQISLNIFGIVFFPPRNITYWWSWGVGRFCRISWSCCCNTHPPRRRLRSTLRRRRRWAGRSASHPSRERKLPREPGPGSQRQRETGIMRREKKWRPYFPERMRYKMVLPAWLGGVPHPWHRCFPERQWWDRGACGTTRIPSCSSDRRCRGPELGWCRWESLSDRSVHFSGWNSCKGK